MKVSVKTAETEVSLSAMLVSTRQKSIAQVFLMTALG